MVYTSLRTSMLGLPGCEKNPLTGVYPFYLSNNLAVNEGKIFIHSPRFLTFSTEHSAVC